MWVKSCRRTAGTRGHLPADVTTHARYANEEAQVCPGLRESKQGVPFVEKSVLSSCQPLEIPGNVIQSCSPKNHSARNSPGQQTQQHVVSGWKNRQTKQHAHTLTHRRYNRDTTHVLCRCTSWITFRPFQWLATSCSRSPCFSPCVTCAWFSSTPRLPVASYKNSFSMTEWRIRLEGSGQSSGTPFEKRLLRSVLLLHFISFPHVEIKTLQRTLGHVSSAAKANSNVLFYT